MTDAQGDRQVAAASTAAVPARIAPSCSAWLPIMKPGSSTKLTIGRLKVSQELDEAPGLARAVRRHGARIEARIVGKHADRIAVQPGQHGDLSRPVLA